MASTIMIQEEDFPQAAVQPDNGNPKKPNKWLPSLLSILVAGVVGLGESVIAVYFFGSFNIFVMLPAFAISFLLFRMDTSQFIDSFLSDQLFRDKGKRKFTGIKKYILTFALILAIFAGLAGGFLQFNSVLVTFGSLIWGLSAVAAVTAPPLALIIIAGTIAIASAVANSALLYANVEKFVRGGEYVPYINKFKMIFGLGAKNTPWGWRAYHAIFAVTGLAFAVVIYGISLGLFKAQAYTAFNSFLKLSAKSSTILTNLIVHPGQLLNGFFYARNILNLVRIVEDFLQNILNKLLPGRYQNLAFNNNATPEQTTTAAKPVSTLWAVFVTVSSTIVYAGIFCCALINGLAQGRGAASEPKAWNWLARLFSENMAKNISKVVMGLGSIYANFDASLYETAIQPSADKIKQVKKWLGFTDSHSKTAANDIQSADADIHSGLNVENAPVATTVKRRGTLPAYSSGKDGTHYPEVAAANVRRARSAAR